MDNQPAQPLPSSPPPQEVQPTPPPQPAPSPLTPAPAHSSSKKYLIAVVILAVILIGGLAAYALLTNNAQQKTAQSENTAPRVTQVVTPAPSAVKMQSPTINPKDSSDAALDKDSQVIDNSMNAINNDIGSVDVGMNQKPADLSQ